MQNQQRRQKNRLDLIYTTHLPDRSADQLYEPLRQISHQTPIRAHLQQDRSKRMGIQHGVLDSTIPHNLASLEVSSKQINTIDKMKKIAEIRKQYQPIQEKVFHKLTNRKPTNETIVYKYVFDGGNHQQNQSSPISSNKFRCVSLGKRKENQAQFRERLQETKKITIAKPKYNIYSVIDQPINALFNKSILGCGNLSNQLIATRGQLVWEMNSDK